MKRKIYIPSDSGIGRKLTVRHPKKIRNTFSVDLPEIHAVQGIWPDSKEEYWVALALYRLHIDFRFQYQLFGGRRYKGGQVVDFWVYTKPLPTPILVQGWYFHYATAERAARSRMNIVYLESRLRGQANKPVEVFDTEMPTPEAAYYVVKRKLGR